MRLSSPPYTLSSLIFSTTFSIASNSFSLSSTGLSDINFAVLSSDQVAAVSSRRFMTLAAAFFSASTTWFMMVRISPGKIMSLMAILLM